jgi:hypothetical protein
MNRFYRRHMGAVAKAIDFGLKAAALTGVSIAVYASEPTYNPQHLGAAQFSQVDEICQKVMGLRPSDTLRDNLWPANPDEARSTNDYRGCVASLSHSVEDITAARAELQADQNCRAKGLEPGSSEFAVCALHAAEARPGAEQIRLASLDAKPFIQRARDHTPAAVPGSVSEERLACAEIGLEPKAAAFASCVEDLKAVMSARFMEELYR